MAEMPTSIIKCDPSNTFPSMLARAKARGMAPATIVDCGASDGSWSRMVHEIWPDANLLLIEANPVFSDELDRLESETAWLNGSIAVVHGMACDRFHDGCVIRASRTEPFQGVYDEADSDHHGSGDLFTVVRTTIDHEVDVYRLPGPYLIKLDVHGREHEILAGARETLKQTAGLVIEVYTWSQGANSMRAAELVPHIEREHGFLPADLCEPLRRPLDGRLVQVDMLFEPKNAAGMDTARYR